MKLSSIQQEIVESIEKNIIVVAGAGSGKTRVLTERIKHLLESGVEAHNIVAITYTNMAADEMKERLRDVVGIGDAFIGTIHSFANRLMGESGEVYQIFDQPKNIELHRQLITRYCKHLTMDRYLEYLDLETKVEEGLVDEGEAEVFLLPSESTELSYIESPEPINEEFPRTIETLRVANKYITFRELLIKATEYFSNLHASIEYVLVDELQDIAEDTYKFIRSLNAKNYFFVGDDWQAIYGFNGSSVDIFLSLVKDKSFKRYDLDTNYRTCENIVRLAETVIHQASNILPKNTECVCKEEGIIELKSKYMIKSCLKRIKQTGNYGSWFILTRNNKEIFELARIMDEVGLPYSSFKKSQFTLAQMNEEMQRDTVKLLTVHTSKGLENDNVLLYGNFPLKYPSYRKNDEERKVMYVGMTRAKKQLWLLN